jgi:hypothetical protein
VKKVGEVVAIERLEYASGPADGGWGRSCEEALVGFGVAIYALFPVVAVTLLGLGDLGGTPTATVVGRLCVAYGLSTAVAIFALVVRLFYALIEAGG